MIPILEIIAILPIFARNFIYLSKQSINQKNKKKVKRFPIKVATFNIRKMNFVFPLASARVCIFFFIPFDVLAAHQVNVFK